MNDTRLRKLGFLLPAVVLCWASRATAQSCEATCTDPDHCTNSCDSGAGSYTPSYDSTPAPPDPEAEERARKAAEEERARLQQAEDEYNASVEVTKAREVRGRDLVTAWEALQKALTGARGRDLPKGLLIPVPSRARTPIAAADQIGCAAFHSSIAVAMESWANTTLPATDASFVDAERSAHEAETVFDRGESIAGCGGVAGIPITGGTSTGAPPRGDAGAVARALPDLRTALDAEKQARAAYETAEAEYQTAKRVREALEAAQGADAANWEKQRGDLDKKVKDADAEQKIVDSEVVQANAHAWALKKEEQHAKYLELLERQAADKRETKKAEDARDAAAAARKAAVDKAKVDADHQKEIEAAKAKAAEEEKKKLDAELKKLAEEKVRAEQAAADLATQDHAPARTARIYRVKPRPTGHRGPR